MPMQTTITTYTLGCVFLIAQGVVASHATGWYNRRPLFIRPFEEALWRSHYTSGSLLFLLR
jgi:hypothetical protein